MGNGSFSMKVPQEKENYFGPRNKPPSTIQQQVVRIYFVEKSGPSCYKIESNKKVDTFYANKTSLLMHLQISKRTHDRPSVRRSAPSNLSVDPVLFISDIKIIAHTRAVLFFP